jgi:hypothetical protein
MTLIKTSPLLIKNIASQLYNNSKNMREMNKLQN